MNFSYVYESFSTVDCFEKDAYDHKFALLKSYPLYFGQSRWNLFPIKIFQASATAVFKWDS